MMSCYIVTIESVDSICRDSAIMFLFFSFFHSFFLSFFFYFYFFKRASSNLCDSFSMVFAQKTTEQCTAHCFFHSFEISGVCSNWSLKNYGFLCKAIFSSHVRMHTNHLAIVIIMQDCSIKNTCMECLKRAWSYQWLQPILHASIEKACKDRHAALW